MRAITWMMMAALAAAPGIAAAQGRGPDQERRAELERQVRHQFLNRMAERLELTEGQQAAVRDVLAESADARRDLMLESRALRIELMQAVRDEDALMSRFEAILERLHGVRERERALEEREQAALAEILTPRQRAVFLMMRMQLNERIQRMRGMRGPGGPPGGPPGA